MRVKQCKERLRPIEEDVEKSSRELGTFGRSVNYHNRSIEIDKECLGRGCVLKCHGVAIFDENAT